MDSGGDNAMHQQRHEGGEYRRIELITGTTRRRQWSAAEKAAIVAESLVPGINVSALARRRGVNRGLLQTWRRAAACETSDSAGPFVPLRVAEAASTGTLPGTLAIETADVKSVGGATIEIEARDMRIRLSGPLDAAALRIVLAHFRPGG